MSVLTRRLVFTAAVSGVGTGFQAGYHIALDTVAKPAFFTWQNETIAQANGRKMELMIVWGLTELMTSIGGLIGGCCTAIVCHKLGARTGLLFNNVLILIAVLFLAAAKFLGSVEVMVFGRAIMGVNIGLGSGLCPLYLSEIAPVRYRGGVSSLYAVGYALASLLVEIIGLDGVLGGNVLWPCLFIPPALVALFQILTLKRCKDSPRYLIIMKSEVEKGTEALRFLQSQEQITLALNEILLERDAIKDMKGDNLGELLRRRSFTTPLFLGIGCIFSQQFSGIIGIPNYRRRAYAGAELTPSSRTVLNILFQAVYATVAGTAVVLIEVLGRKHLLLLGYGGMSIISLLLAISLFFTNVSKIAAHFCIILIAIFYGVFGSGVGTIPSFLAAEFFNQAIRPTAISLIVPTVWISSFLAVVVMPLLEELLDAWALMTFVALNLLFFIVTLLLIPETRNRPIIEICKDFE